MEREAVGAVEVDGLLLQQRQRGELESRRDVWLTAGVMTLLLAPLGTPFGIVALLVATGSRAALDRGELEKAAGKLAICRALVLAGTVLGAGLFLFRVGSMLSAMFTTPELGQ